MAALSEKKVFYTGFGLVIAVGIAILAIGWSGVVEDTCHKIGELDGSTYRIGAFSCEILTKDGRWLTAEEYLDQREAQLDNAEDRMKKYKQRLEEIIKKREHNLKYKIIEI